MVEDQQVRVLGLAQPPVDGLQGAGQVGVVAVQEEQVLAGGLLDWLTWGRPFHSLIAYVDFNLLRGGASTFGVEPFWYYLQSLWHSTGPSLLVLGLLAVLGGARAPALGLTVLANLLVHSWIPHKELRFLVPSLPLACALVGIGSEWLFQRVEVGTPVFIVRN